MEFEENFKNLDNRFVIFCAIIPYSRLLNLIFSGRVIEVEVILEDMVNFFYIFSMEKTKTVENSTLRKRQSSSRAICWCWYRTLLFRFTGLVRRELKKNTL